MTRKRTDTVGPLPGDRGVSDVVAFVFVFSIIITSVGLVSAVGFNALNDLQASEQSVNAERGFESLGYNLGNVQRGHAPGRTGELKLNGGTIRVEENSKIQVNVTDPSNTYYNDNLDLGTMIYDMESRKTTVAYETGAVHRSDRDQSVLVERPHLICKDLDGDSKPDYAVVSIVTLRSSEGTIGGDGTVEVVGREQSSELLYASTRAGSGNPRKVTVSISTSDYDDSWNQFFRDSGNGWKQGGGATSASGHCDLEPGSDVYVRQTVLKIEFTT